MLDHPNKKTTGQGGFSGVFGGQAETAFQNNQHANDTPIPSSAANSKEVERDAKAKRSRSTATGAQIAKLRALLREGPQTTHFLRTQGISHPAGRVQDMRDRGDEIITIRVNTIDDHGFAHINVAKYVLLKEAPRQMPLDVQGAK